MSVPQMMSAKCLFMFEINVQEKNVSNHVSIARSFHTASSCLRRYIKGGENGKDYAYFSRRDRAPSFLSDMPAPDWRRGLSPMLKTLLGSEQWEKAGK